LAWASTVQPSTNGWGFQLPTNPSTIVQTLYTLGIRIKSISELEYCATIQMGMRFTICSAVDVHEEYTNILEVEKTYSDRGGRNPEETDYNSA
jgi:hypothetical protein